MIDTLSNNLNIMQISFAYMQLFFSARNVRQIQKIAFSQNKLLRSTWSAPRMHHAYNSNIYLLPQFFTFGLRHLHSYHSTVTHKLQPFWHPAPQANPSHIYHGFMCFLTTHICETALPFSWGSYSPLLFKMLSLMFSHCSSSLHYSHKSCGFIIMWFGIAQWFLEGVCYVIA